MKGNYQRKDYATALVGLFLLLIVLLPFGGVIILGLTAPFWIAGLLVLAVISVFRRRR